MKMSKLQKKQYATIIEFLDLQTEFNISIDKRVTRHDVEILALNKKVDKSTRFAVSELKKYFVRNPIK